MGIEIALTVLSGVIAIFFGTLINSFLKHIYPRFEKIHSENPNSISSRLLALIFKFEKKELPYSIRIENSLEGLKKASSEIDTLLIEFDSISKERQNKIQGLEKKLNDLTLQESALKDKIQTLEKVPIEAVKHFEDLLAKGDKRSAYRDYILFGSGVVLSVIVGILLKLIGF